MQRWQRRTHLWLWLIAAIVVATALAKLTDSQSHLSDYTTSAPSQ